MIGSTSSKVPPKASAFRQHHHVTAGPVASQGSWAGAKTFPHGILFMLYACKFRAFLSAYGSSQSTKQPWVGAEAKVSGLAVLTGRWMGIVFFRGSTFHASRFSSINVGCKSRMRNTRTPATGGIPLQKKERSYSKPSVGGCVCVCVCAPFPHTFLCSEFQSGGSLGFMCENSEKVREAKLFNLFSSRFRLVGALTMCGDGVKVWFTFRAFLSEFLRTMFRIGFRVNPTRFFVHETFGRFFFVPLLQCWGREFFVCL